MKHEGDLERIKLLVLDVDGVLTDGSLIIGPRGNELKVFNSLDGHGIRMWRRAGLDVGFISGRKSAPLDRRANELGVEHVFQNCYDKLGVVKSLIERLHLGSENVAYIGDDLTDLPPLRYVGFGAAVANGVKELKEYAQYVTKQPGGQGAVREVIEHILKSSGRWNDVTERYFK